MTEYPYDLHIHSCLSPCADDDMTPCNIARMAALKGLKLVALTDHNSCGNCGPFFEACDRYGIIPIAGMELTSAEGIHLMCLFPDLASAMDFDKQVAKKRARMKNRAAVFGNQLLMGYNDDVIGYDPDLLINATALSLEEGTALCLAYGGAAFPAHIEREANGILSILGAMPASPAFSTLEIYDAGMIEPYAKRYGLEGKRFLCSSDAHNLGSISESGRTLKLDEHDAAQSLIRLLREEQK